MTLDHRPKSRSAAKERGFATPVGLACAHARGWGLAKPPSLARRFAAFTLVELLVVVTITLVLTGLLLPVVGRARRQGAQTASLSNLRQLATGALAYAAEHDGQMLPHAVWDASINANREWCYAYNAPSKKEAFAQGILGPYLSNAEKVIEDPSWRVPADVQAAMKRQGKPGAVGFGYNGFSLSEKVDARTGHWQGHRLASVTRPARTVMFATAATKDGGRLIPSENVWSPNWVAKSGSVRAANGAGEAFVAWVNGAVSRERLKVETPAKGDAPAIGWLVPTAEETTQGDVDLFDRE